MKLLNHDNAKTSKGNSLGYKTAIMYLSPFDHSGYNVCPMAEMAGCVKPCLNLAGHGGMIPKGETTNRVQEARKRRTRWFMEDRESFMDQLVYEIRHHIRVSKRQRLIPTVRLNGTSDIRWENVPVTIGDFEYRNIMDAFWDIQFYDYTKIPNRKRIPENYYLTWSYSGANGSYAKLVDKAFDSGMNVAVVFRKDLPRKFKGYDVVDGDETDLRFLDSKTVVVGLRAKGPAKKDTSGFVIN